MSHVHTLTNGLANNGRTLVDLEDRLRSETERREAVERRLQAILPPNLGDLTPQALVTLVLDALAQISELGTQATAAA